MSDAKAFSITALDRLLGHLSALTACIVSSKYRKPTAEELTNIDKFQEYLFAMEYCLPQEMVQLQLTKILPYNQTLLERIQIGLRPIAEHVDALQKESSTDALAQQKQELDEEGKKLAAQADEIHKREEALSARIKQCEEREASLKQAQEKAAADHKQLEQQMATLKERQAEENKLEEQRQAYAQAEAQLKAIKQEVETAEEKTKQAEVTAKQAEEKAKQAEAALKVQVALLVTKGAELEKAKTAARKEYDPWITKHQQELHAKESEIIALKQQSTALEDEVKKLTAALAAAQNDLKTRATELDAMQSKLNTAEGRSMELSARLQTALERITAAEGRMGTLATTLEQERKERQAFTADVDNALQALVSIHALEHLEMSHTELENRIMANLKQLHDTVQHANSIIGRDMQRIRHT